MIGLGAVTSLNGLTDAKFVCAGRDFSFVIDNSGKLRAAHRTHGTELSIPDVGVKFKTVISNEGYGECVCFAIDENDDFWTVLSKSTPGLSSNPVFLFTEVTTRPEFKDLKLDLNTPFWASCGSHTV